MIESLPMVIQEGVKDLLEKECSSVTLQDFSFISGGCVNNGGRLKTSIGNFFIKWNDALQFPGMFEAEANGLNLLSSVNALEIPNVIGHGEAMPYQFILLEFIEHSPQSKNFWTQLGCKLATLHKKTNQNFGLDHQNYIGSLKQFNHYKSSWIEFFIEQRLKVQIKLAIDSGRADHSLIKKFDKLFSLLPSIIPEEKPSLLHGDLWRGNLITSKNGDPCLIDPAVYFGNREIEVAFTKLFGGFDDKFYSAYQAAFPLQSDFGERENVYNLYPLLVHFNLFGGNYLNQVSSIVNSLIN